jgi:hypothetical protein
VQKVLINISSESNISDCLHGTNPVYSFLRKAVGSLTEVSAFFSSWNAGAAGNVC